MKNIIQQIALDLVEKIIKKAFEAKISDIDTLASDVLADCKTAACEILEAAVAQLNESIRKEKATRKELGLVLKEKNRKRSILTELGTLNLPRACREITSLIKLATVMFLSWMQCWDFKDMNASAAMSEQGL